jgi:hypothetical protein
MGQYMTAMRRILKYDTPNPITAKVCHTMSNQSIEFFKWSQFIILTANIQALYGEITILHIFPVISRSLLATSDKPVNARGCLPLFDIIAYFPLIVGGAKHESILK